MFGCIPRPFSLEEIYRMQTAEEGGLLKKLIFFPAKNCNPIPRFSIPKSSHYVD
jgi:hypothetical protein